MIALLLLALIAAQAVSLAIFMDERRMAVIGATREGVIARTVAVVRLLRDTPAALHARVLATASTPRLRFWLDRESAVAAGDNAVGRALRRRLAMMLGGAVDVRVAVADMPFGLFAHRARMPAMMMSPERMARMMGAMMTETGQAEEGSGANERASGRSGEHRRDGHGHSSDRRRSSALGLAISVSLPDGAWLNAMSTLPPPSLGWAWPSLVSMAVTALALIAVVAVTVRRIARPLRRLAVAAEAVGRGEAVAALPEEGPDDVREATRAFNRMHARLGRFVQDRTRMLAAISHDLRTPITALRLRAEFIDDAETRTKVIETLDEMRDMIEATLAFVREEAAREDTRVVDLAALVESLCGDLADMGQAVSFTPAEKHPYACRPTGLKRALRNLIENAVVYGERARVALEAGAGEVRVVIDDDGPGIPRSAFERVFAPFVRIETSRSRATGGIGLGLAIARSIVRGHGGDIVLAHRAEGGFRVTVRLPEGGRA